MSVQTELNSLQNALKPIGLYSFGEDTLLYAELRAYAVGLNMLNGYLSELERECFTATAQSFGLSMRESLCGRDINGASFEQRRKILNYITSVTANDFNLDGIKKAVSTSGINADVAELTSIGTVYINCLSMLDPSLTEDEAKKLAQKFTPAHLNTVFDFRSFNWDEVDDKDMSFNEMDQADMTWSEIDEYTD